MREHRRRALARYVNYRAWGDGDATRPSGFTVVVSSRFLGSLCESGWSLSERTMKNFASKINRFLKSEDGPTAVEYAVMLALIVVVCLGAITAIGTNANTTFTNVANQLGT